MEDIQKDIVDYQTVGICGSHKVLPNEWIYESARNKRETDEEHSANLEYGYKIDIHRRQVSFSNFIQ